jgi:hypothetical protein
MYSCATSSPGRAPVFVTSTLARMLPRRASIVVELRRRFETLNVV